MSPSVVPVNAGMYLIHVAKPGGYEVDSLFETHFDTLDPLVQGVEWKASPRGLGER